MVTPRRVLPYRAPKWVRSPVFRHPPVFGDKILRDFGDKMLSGRPRKQPSETERFRRANECGAKFTVVQTMTD